MDCANVESSGRSESIYRRPDVLQRVTLRATEVNPTLGLARWGLRDWMWGDAPGELTRYIAASLSGTKCMRPILGPAVSRRHLLTSGGGLSLAALAATTIWPQAGASQSG